MQIEKDIPAPTEPALGKDRSVFDQMEIGDSVFVEGEGTNGTTYSSARARGRRAGKRFTARTQEGGVRIWRVA